MKRGRDSLWLAVALLLIAGVLSAAAPARADDPRDILIIANKQVPIDQVALDELREIFLKKRTHWEMGELATPVHARRGTQLRKDFQTRVLQMTDAAEAAHWNKQTIRYGLPEPPEFTNTLKAVFRLKGSVSYVYRADYTAGVAKVLLVLPAR